MSPGELQEASSAESGGAGESTAAGGSPGAGRGEERHPAGSFGELWQVALPLVLSSGSISLMHFMDRVFLTWLSKDALAASMPAGMLHWTVMSVLIGTATYVNTFVAQYDGAGRPDRIAASVWQGIYLSLLAGFSIVLVAPFSEEIFAAIGHAPQVQALEAAYFRVLCVGAVPMVLSSTLSCFYSGRGATLPVLYVNLIASTVDGVFNWLLVFGIGPFPQMGITGAAWATVIGSSLGCVCYVVLILRSRVLGHGAFLAQWRYDRELFGRLLRYGLPTGFQWLTDIAAFTVFLLLVGRIGTEEVAATNLAATNLAFNLNSLAFIPMFGLGTAVTILVGRRIGEGRPRLAIRATWIAFRAASAYMLSWAAVYVLLPDLILLPYAAYAEPGDFAPVRETSVILLRFVALYSFFDGMAIIFGSAIRGAGDTRFSLIFTTVCGWGLMVLPTVYLWREYGGSLQGSWWACTVYIIVLGFGFLMRFQAGHWMSMRVIEHVGAAVPALPSQPSHSTDAPVETPPVASVST